MEVVSLPRQGGKTYRLVEWLKQGHRVSNYPSWSRILLVTDARERDRVIRQYGLDKYQVRVYTDKYLLATLPLDCVVGIDNLDLMRGGIDLRPGMCVIYSVTEPASESH